MSTSLPTFPLWFYIPAALLAALGAIGLYCSLFKGRAKGRLRCPKCWYDMKGATLPTRCPECGTPAETLKDLQHTRRHWRSALIALLLIVPLGVVYGRLHAKRTYYALAPKWKLTEETRFNTTTVSFYHIRDPEAIAANERVTVRSNGKTLIDREDSRIYRIPYILVRKNLIDLNNDDVKLFLFNCFSGGAHCCYRVYIVEIRPEGGVIVADIDSQNYVSMSPPELAGGEPTIVIPDSSFSYWKTSYAESPKPNVYYRLQDGALRIDLDRMNATMTAAAADSLAHESAVVVTTKHGLDPDPILWSSMLDLIYAGHEPLAWVFLDRTWPSRAPGKEEFRKEFLQVLGADPFYQDLTAARAAREAGKPIPPSIVGTSGRAAATP